MCPAVPARPVLAAHVSRSSAEFVPDCRSYVRGNDQENDQTDPWRPTEPLRPSDRIEGRSLLRSVGELRTQARRAEPASRSSSTYKSAVKRRHPRSAQRDTQIARRSGRLGAPRPGSRAGEAAAPHGRWSAPAVRCSTGQRAGRGGGRPPTRQPDRAGPGRRRGYGSRRGSTPSGCGHPG
jgi:hypothetical protein